MTTIQASPSPGAPEFGSPLALVQPRHKNRPSYVQRFKVLRDRNKSLPKLDFNSKASGIPKKYQASSSFSRSYTYDSMKLPSISTCSVVTGVSGKSIQSDGYRRRDREKKGSLQEQQSDSYTDLSTQREFIDLTNNLSKSLQNIPGDKQLESSSPDNGSHRYERISYQKQLSRRYRKVQEKDTTGNLIVPKENTILVQFDKKHFREYQHKDGQLLKDSEREYVLVKDHRLEKQTAPNQTVYTANKKGSLSHRGHRGDGKKELNHLEQSGIYQIDLSNLRNEIPPANHLPHPPVGSAQTERSYSRRPQRSSKRRYSGSGTRNQSSKVVKPKWTEGCDCLRCDILRRQYAEGDSSYQNWGIYPCMKLSKSRLSDMYYDSD